MKKLIALLICCTALLAGCAGVADKPVSEPDVNNPSVSEPAEKAQVPAGEYDKLPDELRDYVEKMNKEANSGPVYATYTDSCRNLDELLEESDIIVRATPVSVKFESFLAVIWELRIEESNSELPATIELRQVKDEFLLAEGKEVVLALNYNESTNDYYIPGGVCGLFRAEKMGDSDSSTMNGRFMDELLERYPNARPKDELTTREVFAMLKGLAE